MLIRLVKMEFEPEKVNIFLEVFAASRTKILGMEGCMGLELLNGIDQKNIFFTHSKWESAECLEKYRKSQLFKDTWAKTKPLFRNKAEAWSVTGYEY
ncbi:MAG: antibiotic biosynthesis monooxygenase [Bacteroidia bacterium]|nr:antibiotic biosynthesis monooxygenase [Bacteroidia bacterium]